jgi:hypothetical protein
MPNKLKSIGRWVGKKNAYATEKAGAEEEAAGGEYFRGKLSN